ncbi:MAG: hypothetical protein ACXW1C_04485 [Gallionella sp.]
MTTQLASQIQQRPYLVRAIHAMSVQANVAEEATELALDLAVITARVAAKFTNNRTAEGILEAMRLTMGCISLSLAYAHLQDDDEAAAQFLIAHGAERVFQQGFRLIKELAELPEVAMLTAYDKDPQEQARQLRSAFFKFCASEANSHWSGAKLFQREFEQRSDIARQINCAQWLRKQHYLSAVKNSDMDAEGVIAIALIFALAGDGKIVAQAGQHELEALLTKVRKQTLDIELAWGDFLAAAPADYQHLLYTHLTHLRTSHIIKLIGALANKTKVSKADIAELFQELQNHGGGEVLVDYD